MLKYYERQVHSINPSKQSLNMYLQSLKLIYYLKLKALIKTQVI